jgi:hypothetical protein
MQMVYHSCFQLFLNHALDLSVYDFFYWSVYANLGAR